MYKANRTNKEKKAMIAIVVLQNRGHKIYHNPKGECTHTQRARMTIERNEHALSHLGERLFQSHQGIKFWIFADKNQTLSSMGVLIGDAESGSEKHTQKGRNDQHRILQQAIALQSRQCVSFARPGGRATKTPRLNQYK
jgi:hypothetical protein